MSSRKYWWVFPVLFLLGVLFDQIVKFYVKLHFALSEDFEVFNWFHIVFVENPGMAFGVTLGSKIFLTSFRLIVTALLVWLVVKLIKKDFKFGFLVVMTMVLIGAVGNIIDCVFYGQIFSESTPFEIAQLVPFGTGYDTWFVGKVVDMFYFPLFTFPNWVPLVGGEIFFSPVFNVADSFITVSVFLIILFYRQSFNDSIDVITKKNKD